MWLLLSALASEPPTCPPASELMDAERWLRAASLDIRGVIPSPEEYLEITSPDALPDALLDEWLASDAFVEQAVRQHRKRLWNRFDTTLVATRNIISLRNGVWNVRQRNAIYRGDGNTECGDFPAQDADNDGAWDVNAQGQEGWVLVHPYWESDPAVTIPVCAFEANEAAVSPSGVECASSDGPRDAGCGCGPELKWCIDNSVHRDLRDAFGASMDHRVSEIIDSGRPYTDLFFEDVIYVNGPLAHFYRNLTPFPAGMRFDIPPFDLSLVPDLAYDDADTWVGIPTDPAHAGALTDPAFLMRFMTNRARVNHFYEDFLCQPLIAPANGIDLDAPVTLDLANRPGCDYCHAIIEPSGLYWGRFLESGGGFMPAGEYPAFDPACYQCSEDGAPCPTYCSRYYTVDPNSDELDPYVGQLKQMQFRPISEHGRVDEGPGGLVQSQIANGRISECLTQKTAEWLLGRQTTTTDADVLLEWNATVLSSGWDYRSLVKHIVTSDAYRRVE